MDIVLMRAIRAESAAQGAEAYLRQLAAGVQAAVPDRGVSWHAAAGSSASAILETARDLEVDAIAMATRGHPPAIVSAARLPRCSTRLRYR